MTGQIPAKYHQKTTRGNRLKGWEQLDAGCLAEAIGVKNAYHLCRVLAGREDGSIALLKRIALELDMTLAELLTRIDQARGRAKKKRRPNW